MPNGQHCEPGSVAVWLEFTPFPLSFRILRVNSVVSLRTVIQDWCHVLCILVGMQPKKSGLDQIPYSRGMIVFVKINMLGNFY